MNNKNSTDKKQRILETAVKLFSQKGFDKTSTKEIAQNAEVAEGTIFFYFKSKKGLLEALLKHSVEIIVQELIINSLDDVLKKEDSKDDKEILKALIKNRLDLIQNNFPLVKIFFSELIYKEDFRSKFIELMTTTGIKVITNYIDKGITEDRFRNINSLIVTRCLVGMIITHIIQNKFVPQILQDYTQDEQIDMMLDLFLNGLLNKPAVN
ncbi:TetR/AcrR family transcriptional regulator [Clostridium ganghwense]|uniref:TetR/AcrR family transcriptional regulator n=1 Tax=Clostridium ganghwense TaxID=312089 RepID=A0ABT4CJT8_9CLOT|nr:TetR/AcrR family transcriptional regulator [Clostridium ganghwense]MCY6369315.1 TetR/AcrR family transcriptional regulator [Clostridium ganghwense]